MPSPAVQTPTTTGRRRPAGGLSAPRPRLLIVDGDRLAVDMLTPLLGELADCDVATDAARAWQRIAARIPDLVLLDADMPGADGHQVCAWLKADPRLRAIPVVFIARQAGAAQEMQALEQGADDFLARPYAPAVLLARVRRLLARAATDPRRPVGRREDQRLASFLVQAVGDPLHTIIDLTALAADDPAQPLPPVQAQRLRHIGHAARRAEALLADLRDLGALQSGSLTVTRAALPVQPLLQRAVASAAEALAQSLQVLSLTLPAAPLWLRADERRLQQCLRQLLDNAIRHSGAGSRIEVDVRVETGACVVEVRDDGVGIGPEQAAGLFEPFGARGHAAGLGLPLTHRLLRAMGGDLRVRTSLGQGSCFALVLPLADAPG